MNNSSKTPKKPTSIIISDASLNYEKCKYCNGMCVVKCITCNGAGRHYFDGKKEMLCDDCKGRGSCICIFCNGTGNDYFNIY
jgi:hypothetical protein